MEVVLAWKELIDLMVTGQMEAKYLKTSSKDLFPPYLTANMLMIHLMQQRYSFSQPEMENTLIEVPTRRRFAGIRGKA